MKKLFCTFLALLTVLTVVLCAACGEKTGAEKTAEPQEITTEAEQPTATEAEQPEEVIEPSQKVEVPEGFEISAVAVKPTDIDGNFQLGAIKLGSTEYEVYSALAKLAVAARVADIYYEKATARIQEYRDSVAEGTSRIMARSTVERDYQYIPEFFELRDGAYMDAALPLLSKLAGLLDSFNVEKYEGYDDVYEKFHDVYMKYYYGTDESWNFNLWYRNSWYELAFVDAMNTAGEQIDALLAVENADKALGAGTVALLSEMRKDLSDLKKVITEYKYYSESPEFFVNAPTGIVCEWNETYTEIIISVYTDADFFTVTSAWGIQNCYSSEEYDGLGNPIFRPVDGKAEICRVNRRLFNSIASYQCTAKNYLGEEMPFSDFHVVSYGPYNCRTQPCDLDIDESWLAMLDEHDPILDGTPYKVEDARLDTFYRYVFGGDYTKGQVASVDNIYVQADAVDRSAKDGVIYLKYISGQITQKNGTVKDYVCYFGVGTPMFEDISAFPLDLFTDKYICFNFFVGEVFSSDYLQELTKNENLRRNSLAVLGTKNGTSFNCSISYGYINVRRGEL